MSAFYAVAYRDRVELLTDGAVYAEDGTLTDIKRKVWTSPVTSIAVAGRGNTRVVEALASAIICVAGCGSFDATIKAAQDLLDGCQKGFPDDAEMIICGISESAGPSIFYFATCDAYGGVEPWTIFDAGRELGGGPMPELDGLDASDGLAGCAVPLLESMRRQKGANPTRPDLPPLHGIGGHIDYTVVSANGCAVERIHEWPDVIGWKIDPMKEVFPEAA